VVLTQAELLAEAAYTELDNLASLKLMLAQEEEVRKRAVVVKKHYAGPTIKYRSQREGEEALVGGRAGPGWAGLGRGGGCWMMRAG
jgi:hypothetical protein